MRLTIFTWILGASTCILAAACGGDHSGVDTGKAVSALTDDDTTSFCSWAVDKYGGESNVASCEAGTGKTGPTKQSCATDLGALKTQGCTATVSQLEDCVKAETDDRCGATRPASCSPIDACRPK